MAQSPSKDTLQAHIQNGSCFALLISKFPRDPSAIQSTELKIIMCFLNSQLSRWQLRGWDSCPTTAEDPFKGALPLQKEQSSCGQHHPSLEQSRSSDASRGTVSHWVRVM